MGWGGGGGHLAPTMRSHALNTGGVGDNTALHSPEGFLCVCVGGGGGGRHCHSTGVNRLVCRLSVHRLN